ncbi:2-hydroxychromene-2-carboxylate isomerase [Pseudomaricurvus alkylphenolicus]|uniref:2-hydroxychromene-2-carboxylate isomerase n=1 Tax=Pseudomaricurvus alkylphenolicus TaxID=1306991 RepID=UPI001422B245|nr:2-hydroxychromene-2-carboxylate isomerase [Pseudomaricurvus alkylphenolicus]NIB38463.1 2-hydroxychromene-2-carboxylate isomerase [Pseudomaricurvus alkylphenolicus]
MIDFYFDFLSPYGYIGAIQIDDLAKKYGQGVDWHPMLLGVSVMKVMGLKPLLETPLKGEYVLKDIPRLASIYGVPLITPKNGLPKPVPPARAFCWVKGKAPEKAAEYGRTVYQAQWRDGRDISEPELLAELAQDMGLDGKALLHALDGDELRQALLVEVNASLELGVFGSPTFVVDGEMIWGCDRLWMLEHWLAHGCWDQKTA